MSEGLLGGVRHHLIGLYSLAFIEHPEDLAKRVEEDFWIWLYPPLAMVLIIVATVAAYVGLYVAAEAGLGQYQIAVWTVDWLAELFHAWQIITAACPIAILVKAGIGFRGEPT